MGNALKPHIENAEKTGAFQFCDKNLNEFPCDVQKLSKCLRTLDLSKNKIAVLPSYISDFSSLKCLQMNNNRLKKLPDEIGSLKKLETLSLNNNAICSLPQTFDALKSLRILSLSNNNFKILPAIVCKLRQLDVLDLSTNKLTAIGNEIEDLQASEVNFNQNQIACISSSSVVSCKRLKILRLEENCLELDAINEELLKDTCISLLALDGNLFEDKKLRDINGYENYMTRFTAAKKKMY